LLSAIVTVIPPGSTVSCPPSASTLPTTIVTVVLAPAASVPDDGTTITSPSRFCDSVMDQFTGPFKAVSVMAE